jgi:hypothetical protein
VPDPDYYIQLLKQFAGEEPPTTRARFDKDWMGGGGSQPRRWGCTDDFDYSVKHPNNPQTAGATHLLATEFVVTRVGLAMGAPVFQCAVVDVSPEMVRGIEYQGQPSVEIAPGRAFGSRIRREDDVVDAGVAPPEWKTSAPNRSRAAGICLLHALFVLGDSFQSVIRKTEPYEVWSIDHGYFISGGGPWPADLGAREDVPDVSTALFPEMNLTTEEIRTAALPLLQLSDEQLARCIAPLPAEWVPSADLRGACLQFVCLRKARIRDLIGVDSSEKHD